MSVQALASAAVPASGAPSTVSAPPPSPTAPAARPARGALGKYREILIAVAFFLMFDLAVLVLNFYVSYRIAEDAVSINLSGRQRMLSQRTAKTLFAMEAELARTGRASAADLEELRQASSLFDLTLTGFRQGATVPGGSGAPVFLPAAASPRSGDILARAAALWTPWHASLRQVTAQQAETMDPAVLAVAATQAREVNQKLLALMNELTTDLELAASSRASTLRAIQTGGIVLALLNFVFILFKFIRRLRQSDAAIEAANDENREILSAVQEGLFLLNRDLRLGTQISRSVSRMFGGKVSPGDGFLAVLQPLVSEKVLEDARAYVELLFAEHVREHLVQGINPLTEVELQFTNRLGQRQSRHLSFQFRRVQREDGVLAHLLVTVQDVSSRVELERKLLEERDKAQKEFGLLVKALQIEPDTLRGFVERSEAALLEVNDVLRGISAAAGQREVRRALERMHRGLHALKGEASMLGLDLLSASAHQFETVLQSLRASEDLRGDALLSIPLPLEELLNRLQAMKRLLARAPASAGERGEQFAQRLGELATRIARETGKQVRLEAALPDFARLPLEKRAGLSGIAIQLVRNAVAHGIEPPAQRQAHDKPAEGCVEVRLERLEQDGEAVLTVRDDGSGLSPARVRRRLLELRWFPEAQLQEMSDAQVVNQIFRSGFSTATEAGEHAGRGVGLDVVSAQVRGLGARLTLSSRAGAGTTFRVRLPL